MIRLVIDAEDRDHILRQASRALGTGRLSELHYELCATLSLACQEADARNELAGLEEHCPMLLEPELNLWMAQTISTWRERPEEDLFRLLRVRMAQAGVWLVVRSPSLRILH